MHTPIDVVRGKIVSYDPERGEMTIKASYPNWQIAVKREYKDCNIELIDARPLSDKQRRSCYALLKEIDEYTGMGLDSTKEYMKLKFLSEDMLETADRIFSLSSAPMSLVCAFQRFLVRFILDWDIPCRFPLLSMVDDVGDYIYSCLLTKHCCVCGKRAQLHHVDRIGMGGNRNVVVHEGLKVLPLCSEHHSDIHTISAKDFNDKYHIQWDNGINLDKTLCRVYGLKMNKDTID